MPTVSVYLTDEEVAGLGVCAKKDGISVPVFMVQLARVFLESEANDYRGKRRVRK